MPKPIIAESRTLARQRNATIPQPISLDAIEEICPAELPVALRKEISRLAVEAGRIIGCPDYWRADFRLDASGAPRALEVNTLPGLQPGYSDITKMTNPAGMGYADLVRWILKSAESPYRRE